MGQDEIRGDVKESGEARDFPAGHVGSVKAEARLVQAPRAETRGIHSALRCMSSEAATQGAEGISRQAPLREETWAVQVRWLVILRFERNLAEKSMTITWQIEIVQS